MMFKETPEVGLILDIIGNETRRKILYLLAEEPRYFIQLSKELEISQQAVLKHLEILERHGFIKSYRAKSDLPAPERKYYRLSRSIYLSIGITEDNVTIQLRNINLTQNEAQSRFNDIPLPEYFEQPIADDRNLNSLLQSSHRLLTKIDEKLEDLERDKVSLLKLRQTVMSQVHDAVRSSFEIGLERDIVYSFVAFDAPLDVDFLSEMLDVREREVERRIEALRKRLTLPF